MVRDWLATARHPRFERPYTELVYQPMLELLAYLRANGFKTFIVSGGGVEFMRPWTEAVYGMPPEQVVGILAHHKLRADRRRHAGASSAPPRSSSSTTAPASRSASTASSAAARSSPFGNSDGDLQMLQWTTLRGRARASASSSTTPTPSANGPTTARRRSASLAKALDEAPDRGWLVVDMKADWTRIYPFDEEPAQP